MLIVCVAYSQSSRYQYIKLEYSTTQSMVISMHTQNRY